AALVHGSLSRPAPASLQARAGPSAPAVTRHAAPLGDSGPASGPASPDPLPPVPPVEPLPVELSLTLPPLPPPALSSAPASPAARIVESAGIWFSPPTPAGREHHVDARRSPAVPTNAAHAGLRIGRAAMRDGERKPERDQEERKSCRSHAKRLLFDDTIPRHQ